MSDKEANKTSIISRRITEKIKIDQAKATNYKLHKLFIKNELMTKKSREPDQA